MEVLKMSEENFHLKKDGIFENRPLFYMAPMEGLTGYIYRNAYHKYFHDIEKYFTPFIANKKLGSRERNDILPEHNAGIRVVPQILTNKAEDFISIAKELKQYGYQSVNLNLGCPSGTVAARHRGAGFLALPEELEQFLFEIFEKCPLKISIKTRIGKESESEWERLLAIYEKFPLEELVIHPRLQCEFYKYKPHMEAFQMAAVHSSHSLCYNGDIRTPGDFRKLMQDIPAEKVMLGRGILINPGLVGQIKENGTLEKEKLKGFHDEILEGYQKIQSGDKNTLYRMKELWYYLGQNFTNPEKYLKKINKSQRIRDYEIAVSSVFKEQELINIC